MPCLLRSPGKLILDRYRRAGADPPFWDQARDHGGSFEGYYWRFTDAEAGRVVIVLCGLTAAPAGRWAAVAVGAHPGGAVRTAIMPAASADRGGFGVRAGEPDGGNGNEPAALLIGGDRELEAVLGPDAVLRVGIGDGRRFPRRALGSSGVAQVVPGLPQYWQPHLMGGRVRGELRLGAETISLDGASAYLEKNWGSAFPERWWWGQADDFDDDVCIAFAGGPVTIAGVTIVPSLLAIRLGDRFVSLAPPLARTRAAVGERGWRIEVRSPRYEVELAGDDPSDSAVALPVPRPDAVATDPRSHQALAGRLRARVRRDGRVLFEGESRLAGLERAREVVEAPPSA
jgi:tocopherol cyclase